MCVPHCGIRRSAVRNERIVLPAAKRMRLRKSTLLSAKMPELDAKPVLLTPDHAAWKTRTFGDQHKTFRNADRARYVELRTGV
jgi:hypothetical protein